MSTQRLEVQQRVMQYLVSTQVFLEHAHICDVTRIYEVLRGNVGSNPSLKTNDFSAIQIGCRCWNTKSEAYFLNDVCQCGAITKWVHQGYCTSQAARWGAQRFETRWSQHSSSQELKTCRERLSRCRTRQLWRISSQKLARQIGLDFSLPGC